LKGAKPRIRRQHPIGRYVADFIALPPSSSSKSMASITILVIALNEMRNAKIGSSSKGWPWSELRPAMCSAILTKLPIQS
jgi:hypothetical protein